MTTQRASKKAPLAKPAPKVSVTKAKDERDPRFEPVVAALSRTKGFSLMESTSGGTRGMRWNGASIGMSSHGRFILKLTEERAAELIHEGQAEPFEASPGRAMRGWIVVTDEDADWVALAKEALDVARAGSPKKATKSRA